MKESYSIAAMRAADERTIANGTPSLTLMERAGEALADAVQRAMARVRADEALFVCGGGNNGGDGFVAARILSERGICVSVLCLAEKFSRDCLAVKALYRGTVMERIPRRRYPLIVDCVLGTGVTRAPEGNAKDLISFISSCGAYVISADIPSGLGENGVAYEPHVTANETVCMGLLKNALLLEEGADVSGDVTVAKIGVSSDERGAEIWEDGDVAAYFPKKKSCVNKGTFGSACILAGEGEYAGAPFLAAGACLKSGVGYTKLILSESVFPHAIGKLPACIVRKFRAIDEEILSCSALAVGMGAGVSERLYGTLKELLSVYRGTLVLDADALNTLSRYGAEILKEKSCRVAITPHLKEFARLCNVGVAEVRNDSVALAREFAERYGVVVLLKSNRSLITDGARTAINVVGSPALAKGGSGDALAGFLAGTCARGVPPFEACCVSAYVCGRAGEIAAAELGEYAPDATDVIARLPNAMKSLFPSENA
ncbi:MAG: NAD(P)H-hydrate dehydratase [Candidatus Gallimonas sp.]